jgi:hypothetical protein
VSFLSKRGYAIVKSRPAASGGRLLLLTSKGRKARETYRQRVFAIEERWQAQFGSSAIGQLRESLESLVGDPAVLRSPLFGGLEPYPDGWRASIPKPEGLPHYPTVADGFGPSHLMYGVDVEDRMCGLPWQSMTMF